MRRCGATEAVARAVLYHPGKHVFPSASLPGKYPFPHFSKRERDIGAKSSPFTIYAGLDESERDETRVGWSDGSERPAPPGM